MGKIQIEIMKNSLVVRHKRGWDAYLVARAGHKWR